MQLTNQRQSFCQTLIMFWEFLLPSEGSEKGHEQVKGGKKVRSEGLPWRSSSVWRLKSVLWDDGR